jgi:hypothetical protein
MTTKLNGSLKREIDIHGAPYVVTLAPDAMTIVLKGKRKGLELRWSDLVSGEAALATALNASLTANIGPAAASSRSAAEAGVSSAHPTSKRHKK